jgi:uncharacterized protein YegL
MSSKLLRSAGVFMLLLLLASSIPATAQAGSTVSVTFDVAPPTIVVDETPFTVTLSLNGQTDSCPIPPTTQPVDAVLVIDISGSMGQSDGALDSPLAYARQAAELFVQALSLNVATEQLGDQVGLVAFDDSAVELQPLSQDANQLIGSIRGLNSGGGTDIAAGLLQATDTVIDPLYQNTNASRVVVLLSDGGSDEASAILAAERARSAGVRVITIAVGQSANSDLLERLADSPADFYDEPNAANLPTIFQRIADLIQISTAARNLQFTYTFDNTAFELVPDAVISPPPVSVTPNSITWALGVLDNATSADFQFQMRGVGVFTQRVIGQLNGNYLLCETDQQETFAAAGPTVSVVLPSPTPTFTRTPTPRPTNTPPPSSTPTPPSLELGSFVPSPPTVPSFLTTLSLCSGILGILIPLLLALLFLAAALWWMLRQRKRHADGLCTAACFLWWSAFGFYTAFALWLFTLPVVGTLCPAEQSVYFWRQEPSSGYTGVYLAAPNAGEAASFNAINAGRCVGCHTVSQSTNRIAAVGGSPPNELLVYDFNGTRMNIPRIQAVYAAFSPDGERLVYVTAAGDLHILDLNTNADTPLQGANDPRVLETMPAWGPDGMIAFVRPVNPLDAVTGYAINGDSDIYVIPEGGGEAVPLTGASGDGFNYYPAYSPDGRWLSFTHHNNRTTYSDPEANIYIIPAAGGQPIEIAANRDSNGYVIPGAANSWSSWSLDSQQLAFNSQRNDPNYDIYTTTINEDGSSTAAVPLAAASQRGVFEHLPFWGLPAEVAPLGDQWLGLLPFLLPIPLLALLAWVNCQQRTGEVKIPLPENPIMLPPPPPPEPLRIPPLIPPWQPQPTLVIGLGESGRWVLTHLKKTLSDAGLGDVPTGIQLLALDVGNWAQLQTQDSPVQFANVHLTGGEVVELNDNLADELRRLRSATVTDPHLRSWLDPERLVKLGDDRLDLRSGANGQRTLARFGLLRHLQQSKENFFTRLHASAAAVLRAQSAQQAKQGLPDDRRLHIVVVADTFGDISSSALFDAALLAREAGRQNDAKGCRITAHIMTDQVREGISQHKEIDQTNTGATLREIARFQLADARPFPIHYEQIAAGRCDYLPFDEFILYDGTGQDLQAPQTTVYPAVADAIALGMDSAARQDTLMRNLRRDETSKISAAQGETDEVHIIGQGIFTYRLPFADLIEVITYRFQQEIFRAFVMGRSLNETDIRLDEKFNAETFGSRSRTGQAVASDFLRGKIAAVSAPHVLNAMQAIDFLLSEWDANAGVSRDNVKKAVAALRRSDLLKEDEFSKLLTPLLSLLLNGQAATIKNDIFAARGGKIGFVLAFLAQLQVLAKRAQTAVELIEDVTDKRDSVAAALQKLAAVAANAETSLTAQAEALGLIGKPSVSVRQLVMPRVTALDERQQEMDSIKGARAYLWRNQHDQPLEKVWYHQYLVPEVVQGQPSPPPDADKRQAALAQFYWEVAPLDAADNIRIYLTLVGENGKATLNTTPDAIDAFDTALSDLASRYCAPIISEQTLARTLVETLLNDDRAKQTINTLIDRSQAQISVESDGLKNALSNVIIAANSTVDLRGLQNAVSYQAGYAEGEGFLRLNITDPYSVSVNRRLAALPLDGVTSLENARETYRKNHDLITVPNAKPNPNPIPTAVYESEAAALTLEAQYRDKLRENPKLLHPVIVTSFTDEARTRGFYLALAAGELEMRKVRAVGNILVFNGAEGEKQFPPPKEGEHPLIAGLMTFLLDDTLFPASMIEAMIERYRTDDEAAATFKQWTRAGWNVWTDDLDQYDDRSSAIVLDILRVSRLLAERYRQ